MKKLEGIKKLINAEQNKTHFIGILMKMKKIIKKVRGKSEGKLTLCFGVERDW